MSSHDPQMLKGVLALLLLHELAREDSYGYSVLAHLQSRGFDDLGEGTVYPALTRLENSGLAESYLRRSETGPARKYYRLTEAGRAELGHRTSSWHALVEAVDRVLDRPIQTPLPPKE
ncbi:PadR family transcriptional regulator [Mobilicoccus massiliensis]|uniref:PadR family transcriptional regulator n=1 Tax=Mobilicoccus massiliensis TaxID=1522310 RepID=UPI00058D3690|nr:PadR family transcriptional regulator [Mobilicoccus massiliensis]